MDSSLTSHVHRCHPAALLFSVDWKCHALSCFRAFALALCATWKALSVTLCTAESLSSFNSQFKATSAEVTTIVSFIIFLCNYITNNNWAHLLTSPRRTLPGHFTRTAVYLEYLCSACDSIWEVLPGCPINTLAEGKKGDNKRPAQYGGRKGDLWPIHTTPQTQHEKDI